MKRCPWLIWPAFTPANSIGRVFPPQSATSQRTGLANRTPVSFHCIALGNESLSISPGRCWVRTAAADCPFSCLTAQTYSPLAVGLTCNASTGTPWEAANPIAALVGRPAWSKATAFDGPRASFTADCCCVANCSTIKTRRRGVPMGRICPQESRWLCSIAVMPSCRERSAGAMN